MNFSGKVALVTGAGQGIGEEIAKEFARKGARVALMASRREGIERVAEEIRREGGRALALCGDVSIECSMKNVVEQVVAELGEPDILVNNAGIQRTPAKLFEMEEKQWDEVLAVNLKGAFFACKSIAPYMMKRRHGRVILISSLAARRMSFFGSVDYTVSKYGISGLNHHFAWEMAEYGVTVNAICPGSVKTPMLVNSTTKEYLETIVKSTIPLGRMILPEDIAATTLFLASEEAAMITGQEIEVTGGPLLGLGEYFRPMINQRIREMREKAARREQH